MARTDITRTARFLLRTRYRVLAGVMFVALFAAFALLLLAEATHHQAPLFLALLGAVAAYLVGCLVQVVRGPAVVVSRERIEVPRFLPLPRRVHFAASGLKKMTLLASESARWPVVGAAPLAILGREGALLDGMDGVAGAVFGGAIGGFVVALVMHAFTVGIPEAPVLRLKTGGRSAQRINCRAYVDGEDLLDVIQAAGPDDLAIEDRAA